MGIRCQREDQTCWCWKSETPQEPCCSPCSQLSKHVAQPRSQPDGLDGTWSFRPFVLLSMAIPAGLILLGKGCQQVRFCFPNSKIMPVLPSLPSLCWLSFSSSPFLPHNFPSFYFHFPLFPFLSSSSGKKRKKRVAHAALPLITSYFFKWLAFSTSLSKLPVSTISSHPSCLCWLLEALLPF